jgi:hypothetical protein
MKSQFGPMKYVHGIPIKKLRKGWVLVHNHIRPQKQLRLNGFRAWIQPLNERLVVCKCHWAGVDLRGLTHYRVAGLGKLAKFVDQQGSGSA